MHGVQFLNVPSGTVPEDMFRMATTRARRLEGLFLRGL
jgi:hypothetical protein